MTLSPEEVVFVGDTLTDIETGRQAGVDVYSLPTGFYTKTELSEGKPRRILKNLKELLLAVDGLFVVKPVLLTLCLKTIIPGHVSLIIWNAPCKGSEGNPIPTFLFLSADSNG
jgi:hypothetical protein